MCIIHTLKHVLFEVMIHEGLYVLPTAHIVSQKATIWRKSA